MSRRWEPWPWGLAAFFLIFVGFIVGTLIKFGHTHVSLVRKDYYDPGPARVALLQAQQRSRQDSAVVGPRWDATQRSLRVAFLSPKPDSARVTLYRPSDDRLDRHFALDLSAQDTVNLDLHTLRPGRWQVQLSWWRRGKWYYRQFPLTIGG